MPQENDPTKKFLEATNKYQSRLFYLWKTVFKKVKTMLKTMVSFVNNIIGKAKEIAAIAGKKVVDQVVNVGSWIVSYVEGIPLILKKTIRLGKKIVALIQKAADPTKIVSTLKKLFSRYMNQIREIYDGIVTFVSQLDAIGPILSVVNTFKNVLRVMFSWITDVTRANDAAVRVKRLLKKVIKEMRVEIKEAIKLRREVMKLKIPAT